jgi:LysR family hydrogen peroxide-inducible transcriptional activator
VERRPGEVVLTATGLDVLARADRILIAVNDLVEAAHHRGRPLTGAFRLGVIPTVAPYLLPPLLRALQAHYPELKLEIRETQTDVLLRELRRGQLDAVLVALPVEGADLETSVLLKDDFYFAMPADDPLARNARVSVEDVSRRKLILLEEGHCLRDQALSFCATPPDLSAGLGATSLATVMQMVASGYGATLVPEIALAVEARDPRIQVRPFHAPTPARSLGLVWRRVSPRRADFGALADIVRETMQAPAKVPVKAPTKSKP